MQKHVEIEDFVVIDETAAVAVNSHGGRAKCLQRLIRLNLPVPQTVALPFDTVRKLARGEVVLVGAEQADREEDRSDQNVKAVETGRHVKSRAVRVATKAEWSD